MCKDLQKHRLLHKSGTAVCNSVTMCVFVLRVLTCCGFMCFLCVCVCVIIGLCACVVESLEVLIVC